MTKDNYSFETLILVAVWESPFIFQGSYKIVDKDKQTEQFLFYRCECGIADKTDIIEKEFSPYEYHLTHLYRIAEDTPIDVLARLPEDSLYLLKYALHISLTQMIRDNKQYLTYIDEIALIAMSKRIGAVLTKGMDIQKEEELGFAVAMNFNPTEPTGQEAVKALLNMNP